VVVVLATDADAKRGCSFAGQAVEAGVRAAHQQGLIVVKPQTEELLALAKDVPLGRLSTAGKVVCSFIKQEVYERFAALVGTEQELRAQARPDGGADEKTEQSAPPPPPPTDLWTGISAGAIVLATVGRDDGWWEAVVHEADPIGEKLILSWRDWPGLPRFTALRRSVALTAPKA
jgi:hypothetical protein